MNSHRVFVIVAIVLNMAGIVFAAENEASTKPSADPQSLKLCYEQPATQWTEALPIGNGRLGAMVYGGVQQEHLQLNEDTLWSGGPHSYDNPDAYQHLATVRNKLVRGKYREAEETAQQMLGIPKYQRAYMPLGDLYLDFSKVAASSEYSRELNLKTAVSKVSYRVGDARFTRTVFASHPDQSIVMRLECDKPGQITFDLTMKSQHSFQSRAAADDTLLMTGHVDRRGDQGSSAAERLIAPWDGEGMAFAAKAKVTAEGGKVVAQGDKIAVTAADAVTIVYVAATNYINYQDVSGDPSKRVDEYLVAVGNQPFDQLYQRHVADYSELFQRVSFQLGSDQMEQDLPTNERLNRVIEGTADPHLTELIFQYGRYLMIAGSRPGTQPLNLQGIWNDRISPPWGSKYTVNINIEMNYWVAEVCNLSQCHEPLLRMVSELQAPGRNTAKVHYQANGWVAHHNTDLWRGTAPVDGAQWGMWPTGGAWLCQHLWEHYQFTGDAEHLKKSYPILKGAAEFFMDVLVENKDGYLITSPSISPEHSHGGGTKDGLSVGRSGVAVCAGPTMDLQIIRDLFTNCIAASEILGVDDDFRSQVAKTRSRLQLMKVGRHGQLQEWLADWDNPDDQHSHVSHLYGLYPSSQINRRDTPKLFKAARNSLIQRGDKGGWPGAWRISLWARVGDGDRALVNLQNVMNGLASNLFNGDRFQIDANFGATAGIAEMLLQSHGGEIHLLPALPKAWPAGRVKGLRARGGFEVDIEWKAGQLVEATIRADQGGNLRLTVQGNLAGTLSLNQGESKVWSGN